jgi:iron complex outermembrane receptor protein
MNKIGTYKLLALIGFFLLIQSLTVAQKHSDTIELTEVQVSSDKLEKFQAGAKIEKISTFELKQLQDGNLSDLLIHNMPVAIKTDAGGLATIHIRGTSSNHTTVNFGEIDLNSQTLGNSNLAKIPLYLFDDISLQYGSSAAVKGSGNIGGAIHLSIENNWTKGFKAEVRSALGSFGEQLYGTKLFFGNGKWESVSRLYYYYKTNDFKFINTNIKDYNTGIIGVNDIQQNANLKNKGILQEFNYLFTPGKTFKLNIWLENNWYNIQQNQSANYYNPHYKETYEDDHIRILANLDNRANKLKTHLGVSYSFDNAIYNQSPDLIKTNTIICDGFVEYDLNKNISYKTGTKISRIYPTVYAYDSSVIFENRADFYFLYSQQLLKKLQVTINLRYGFVTNYKIPFVPALGLSYSLFYNQSNMVKINGNISKSYRVPSFNDRFWVPGGNPNLLPENGMNYDIGLDYVFDNSGFNNRIKVNAYFIDVDNWILWRNGGSFWYADNVQRVQSKGIELINEMRYKIGQFEIMNHLQYSFTHAERIESTLGSSAVNRQLEYIPLHSAMFSFTSAKRNFHFSVNGAYNYQRYTDETQGNILPQLFLLNTSAGYQLEINELNNLNIKLLINNILNKNYQSTFDYAMPRINYRISLTYNFK